MFLKPTYTNPRPGRAPRFLPPRPREIAVAVIREALETGVPADRLLSKTLHARRSLTGASSRLIAAEVFSWFRWQGWFEREPSTDRDIEEGIVRAASLEALFNRNPEAYPAELLRKHAVPLWIFDEMEVSDDWLRALQIKPVLWVRAQGSRIAEVLKDIRGLQPGPESLPGSFQHLADQDLFETKSFKEGWIEVQDVSSQAVGLICDPQPGETWWDTCAGEGGKTMHLSERMRNKGLIWATDRADWRLDKLKRRAARAGAFNYRTAPWDGGEKLPTKSKCDGVLIDAPCSGVGTWQRNPHARWMTQPKDVTELAEVQKKLLHNACGNLKPGGKLIYSVCTLTRSETSGVVDHFNQAHPEFEPMPFASPFMKTKVEAPQWFFRPQDTGGNGMFVAAWRRRA